MLPSNLKTQEAFEIGRARLAVRGKIDDANRLNYFFMTEFAQNGITNPAGHPSGTYLTDASITYRATTHLNIRLGQFKYPGSEEGMRAVFASPYKNFSTVGNMLLLERFIPNDSKNNNDGTFQANTQNSVGAYRDRGVEIFSKYEIFQNNELSYAFMIGNGRGISAKESNTKPTYYAYLSHEYLFHKGKGFYSESLKTYAWYQNGDRMLNNENYKRERYGIGFSYFHQGLRLGGEFIQANGMIYNGVKDSDSGSYNENWGYQIAADSSNQAKGYYLNAQYFIVDKKLELITRYDYLDRLYNEEAQNRVFNVLTLGASYHFKGSTRVDFNYALRNIEAPSNTLAQSVVDNVGNLLSVQATLKF